MSAMVLLYLLDVLLPFSLSSAASVAAAVVLAVNLPFIGKTFRLPAWAFFLIGAGVLLACRAPLGQWSQGLQSMMKTAVILIVMQSLSLAMGRMLPSSFIHVLRRCSFLVCAAFSPPCA